MNESVVNKAASALSKAVSQSAIQAGGDVEARTKAKAAGLSAGNFAQGGYTYNRIINPVVAPMQAALVTAAQQALFRQSAKNAMNSAQIKYDASKLGMQDRQQAAQKKAYDERQKEKREAERRQKEYDRMAKAQYSSSYGGGGGGGSYTVGTGGGAGSNGAITGYTTTPTKAKTSSMKYSGNADFRGWAAANGYGSILAYTGNKGVIDAGKVNRYGADTPVFSYAPGQAQKVQSYVNGLYSKYRSLGGK